MLLEFRGKNYKSFKNEFVLSLIPTSKRGLDYSIMRKKIDNKEYKGLSSAVIYGPNASGKTNIMYAMDTLKSIVLRGNINNNDDFTPNFAANRLELIPNVNSNEPTFFQIKFTTKNYFVDYSLEIDLGEFLDSEYDRKVISEELVINKKSVFKRDCENIAINKNKFLNKSTVSKSVFSIASKLANDSLKPNEIFLTNGFKNIFNQNLVLEITSWFEKDFKVFLNTNKMRTRPVPANAEEDKCFIDPLLNKALSAFGMRDTEIIFKPKENNSSDLISVFKSKGKTKFVPSDIFESYGTLRFINQFPLVLETLETGGTLIVDEFDASIHPMALMSIVNVFHNDEVNINHAQLIFNTHNPIFLDHSLFRRDEIKFVEYDKDSSTTYSLSDFSTSETTGARANSDYMKNYFVNRYGAITNVDFTDVFDDIMKKQCEGNNDETEEDK